MNADREVLLARSPQAQLRVEPAPGALPDGVRLEFERLPEGPDVKGSVLLDTGRSEGRQRYWAQRVDIAGDGRATVPVRRRGLFRVSA